MFPDLEQELRQPERGHAGAGREMRQAGAVVLGPPHSAPGTSQVPGNKSGRRQPHCGQLLGSWSCRVPGLHCPPVPIPSRPGNRTDQVFRSLLGDIHHSGRKRLCHPHEGQLWLSQTQRSTEGISPGNPTRAWQACRLRTVAPGEARDEVGQEKSPSYKGTSSC